MSEYPSGLPNPAVSWTTYEGPDRVGRHWVPDVEGGRQVLQARLGKDMEVSSTGWDYVTYSSPKGTGSISTDELYIDAEYDDDVTDEDVFAAERVMGPQAKSIGYHTVISNPSTATWVIGVAGAAGFTFWRKRQQRKLLADLEANPPFSELTESQRQEIVRNHLPFFGIKTAKQARVEIFGHSATLTEMLSRYVPGMTEAREGLDDLQEAAQSAAGSMKKKSQVWWHNIWSYTPFGGVSALVQGESAYGDAYGVPGVRIPGMSLMMTVAAVGLMWHRSRSSSVPARVGKTAAIAVLPFASQIYLGYLGYQYAKEKL